MYHVPAIPPGAVPAVPALAVAHQQDAHMGCSKHVSSTAGHLTKASCAGERHAAQGGGRHLGDVTAPARDVTAPAKDAKQPGASDSQKCIQALRHYQSVIDEMLKSSGTTGWAPMSDKGTSRCGKHGFICSCGMAQEIMGFASPLRHCVRAKYRGWHVFEIPKEMCTSAHNQMTGGIVSHILA